MKTKQYLADIYEVEELAAYLCGLNYDDSDHSEIEDALYEKYEIPFDNFHELISSLLTMIDVGKSPLTDTRYKGFSKVHDGFAEWVCRTKVNDHKK